MNITKRTFEALKYPKGSQKRIELNENIITSEYQQDYRYVLEIGDYQLIAFKTRSEAEEYIK